MRLNRKYTHYFDRMTTALGQLEALRDLTGLPYAENVELVNRVKALVQMEAKYKRLLKAQEAVGWGC